MQKRSGVYVLLLEGDRYYVGCSSDIDSRIRTHINEPRVSWITANGGVQMALEPMTPAEEPLTAWEMRETMARMIKHGFNNVRGWEYCSPEPLGNSDVDGLFKLICGGQSAPLCHACGFPGHLSSACTTSGRAKWLDDLKGCRSAKRTGSDVILALILDGGVVSRPKRRSPGAAPTLLQAPTVEPQFVTFEELNAQKQGCTRCGRHCHTLDACYARTSAAGKDLHAPANS